MAIVKIDGIEVEVGNSATIMQAAEKAGVEIPHLCYEKHLSLSGTCRLCMVEVAGVPKLQSACSTPVRDGMEVITTSEKVAEARRGVLEFLLLNHPLDCPVCDQAGECKLQDYVFQYGSSTSRFDGVKRTYPRMDIGKRLVRNMNRCVHCLRCVRFCSEVTGEEILGSFHRGGRKDVGTYVEVPVENGYVCNLVELCPVGALTSTDFRFKARVWNLVPVDSLCPGCSTGCNVKLWVKDGEILRVTPRENPEVNGAWMCDLGRGVHKFEDSTRLKSPVMKEESKFVPVGWDEACDSIVLTLKEIVDKFGPRAVGGIGSCQATNEANYMFSKLIRGAVGSGNLDLMEKGWKGGCPDTVDGILLRADRSPNYRGALDMGIAPGEGWLGAKEMLEAGRAGSLKALFIMGADPLGSPGAGREEISRALEELELLVVLDPVLTETAAKATLILPTLFSFESGGTFTNYNGRVQKLNPAFGGFRNPEGCRADWDVLSELCRGMGVKAKFRGAGDVMEEIAREIPVYKAVSYATLGDRGLKL